MEDGQITFEAKGKRWTLEFTIHSEREVKKITGQSIDKALADFADIDNLLAIFIAGLRTHHPQITEDEASGLVKPRQLRELVSRLIAVTYSDNEENPQVPSQTAQAGSAD